MLVEVWFDYVCPWCYLALDRTDHLRHAHGVAPMWRPYELHPDTPAEGRVVGGGGGAGRALTEAGLEVTRVERLVNSHRALTVSAGLADHPAWSGFHRGIFAALFAQGRDISDPEVLGEVARRAGIDQPLDDAAAVGEARLRASIDEAWEAGIGATPAWRFAGEVVLTGAHPTQVLDRVIRRLSSP